MNTSNFLKVYNFEGNSRSIQVEVGASSLGCWTPGFLTEAAPKHQYFLNCFDTHSMTVVMRQLEHRVSDMNFLLASGFFAGVILVSGYLI